GLQARGFDLLLRVRLRPAPPGPSSGRPRQPSRRPGRGAVDRAVAVRRGAGRAWAAPILLAAGAALAEDAVLHLPIGDPARKDREANVVLDAITDTESGRALEPRAVPRWL